MKTENFLKFGCGTLCDSNNTRAHSQNQRNGTQFNNIKSSSSTSRQLTSENLKGFGARSAGGGYSDKDSICSGGSITARNRRLRSRHFSMKSAKGISKKSKTMDYTNYAYNEAVGRLKMMLADTTYATPKASTSYLRNFNEDSGDNFSDNMSVIERPVYSDISKYLSPSQKSRITAYRPKKSYTTSGFSSSSKENLTVPALYPTAASSATEYLSTTRAQLPGDSVQAPVEIFNFIEKQEDYIEQLEKESKYCRNELSNLLGKVKDVINENEQLTENARSELAALTGGSGGGTGSGNAGATAANKLASTTSPSSDSDEQIYKKMSSTPRKKEALKSPRYASAPNIVYEARISELEAELMQSNIDLKRLKTENEELKRKLAHADPLSTAVATVNSTNCDTHRKQIEHLQMDKSALEESVRQLQKLLDETKSQQYNTVASKRYINDLVQMERSQAELEVKHLRDELDRQHERVRELQHEMARRLADERANAERRYNTQVDQLGGDLSSQWEQVAKLQLDLERQKRYETDLKRDLANRNSQIDELKMELRSNRSTFLADMAQVNAEKQSLEQEINALRLQLDRAARESKTESARLNAEISSLRQRLDRGDADLLHSKREVLRLNDEIANLEKELAYGELKNEIRPTKKDLDQRISEMQDKHAETVNDLEEMIQNQKQLMDKLTNECKKLTNKLEDTTLKHNQEKQQLRETNEKLMARLKQIWDKYKLFAGPKLSHSRSSSSVGGSESDIEHFSSENSLKKAQQEQKKEQEKIVKPLSTTSRPHLAQPTPYVPHLITTTTTTTTATTSTPMTTPNQMATAMTTYWANQAPEMHSPQQLLWQLQQRQIMATSASSATNMNHSPATSATAAVSAATAMATTTTTVTSQARPPVAATIMDSTITMTKISRTTLAWERNNNNSSSNNNSSLPVNLASHTQTQHSNSRPSSRTWPAMRTRAVFPTTTPTTAPMATTISSSMTPVCTTPAHMISSRRNHNMSAANNMAVAALPMTMAQARVPPIMDKLDTSMTPRRQPPQPMNQQQRQQPNYARHQQQQHQPQQHQYQHHQQQQQRHHYHRHHQPYQPQQRQRPESEEALQAAQQQRAAYNRARAAALWGQQVQLEQSPEENPLCHNSLPRQPPARSNGYDSPEFTLIDPNELEFSISSPSLIRSCESDTCTEIADNEYEDGDDGSDDDDRNDGIGVENDAVVDDDDNNATFVCEEDEAGEGAQQDSDLSVSPAHTTIVTVRRASNDVCNDTFVIEQTTTTTTATT